MHFWIVAVDTIPNFAFGEVPRYDRAQFDCALTYVKSQISLTFVLIWAVAGEAVVGKDRSNVACKGYRFFGKTIICP